MNDESFIGALLLPHIDTDTFLAADFTYYDITEYPSGRIGILKDVYLVDQKLAVYAGDVVSWDWDTYYDATGERRFLNLRIYSRANKQTT